MTEKELKNLNRADLLEMLLSLSKENEKLKEQLEEAQKNVENKKITVKKLGNIAEASLQLNGVFDAAQAACDQYIENVKMMVAQCKKQCAKQEKETNEECERMLQEAGRQSEDILEDANQQYREIVEEAQQYADNIIIEAQQKCDVIWEDLHEKIKEATGYDFDMKYLLFERFGVDMEE